MNYIPILFLLFFLFGCRGEHKKQQLKPISLHPENGHCFLFRDKPAILIISGEHYEAVLNLDFDYIAYLNTLQHTRGVATLTKPENLKDASFRIWQTN